MKAYHNDTQIKTDIVLTLAAHREADQIIKGQYWKNGKGCAVGCTVKSNNHMAYESQFGIPVTLAWLEDRIFEGLPNEVAMLWPERFMSSINVGSDLSLVGWKFQWWLLTDNIVNPGIDHPLVKEAVKLCANAIYPLTKGLPVDESARLAAVAAAWSARLTARPAAESAVWSARLAAWSAESARPESARPESARSEWSARLAAESAAAVARSESARSEWSEWSVVRSAAYEKMADKLIELISQCEAS